MTKKITLSWDRQFFLPQTHTTERSTLVVSGCSFTDTYGFIEQPRTWAGYLCVRAGFDKVIDVSSGGSGNEYISTSILNQIESMSDQQQKDCMVIIMWSGMDRKDLLIQDPKSNGACIDDIRYDPDPENSKRFDPGEALRSWKNIIMMQNYLENKKIPFGFSFYINTFDPPFLPRRIVSSGEWRKSITSREKIQKLRTCSWIHDHQDCMFEFSFKNDYLQEDLFHPTIHGHLAWTDNVLLPGLVRMGLVRPVDQ